MEFPLLAIAILVIAYIALECFNLLSCGGFLLGGAYRFVRSQLNGTQYVSIPEQLKIPLANQLLDVGSELIVGSEPEWDGHKIIRHSISPEVAGQHVGAKLRIHSFGQRWMEIRLIPNR
jgi:hypothetical protein